MAAMQPIDHQINVLSDDAFRDDVAKSLLPFALQLHTRKGTELLQFDVGGAIAFCYDIADHMVKGRAFFRAGASQPTDLKLTTK